MKFYLLLVLAAIISFDTSAMGSKQPEKAPSVAVEVMKPATSEEKKPSDVPTLTVSKCLNCTGEEFARIKAAEVKVNEVVDSQCFRSKMESRKLIQTGGRTPAQVVDSLVSANIVIETEMYYTIKRVLGYTLDGVNKEWINRRYMMSWNVCDLASLLAHETSHKVGYTHDYYSTSRRPYSVPYSANWAFEEPVLVFKACCQK
jgi:hypothetical protein